MVLDSMFLMSTTQMAAIITLTIAITKGITDRFKISSGYAKFMTTILVSLWLFYLMMLQLDYVFLFRTKDVILLITNYLVLLLSSMGVYNFIPEKKE